MNPKPKTARRARRAFTLVELLVVMAIIAIVIALVLPALGSSRNAVRAGATKNQLTQITNAVGVFGNDNSGRMPGPFTARQMGHTENFTRGMSGAENAMLGLMGYSTNPSPALNANVGPSSGATVPVDLQTLGVPGPDSKQYYVPEKKLYIPQLAGTQQMGQNPHTDAEGVPQLPDVVDAFGQPLLVWVADDTHITKPTNPAYKFAAINAGTGNTAAPAKYYWSSNSCFLTATALGKKGMDQTSASNGSMIGLNAPATETSLTGALGSPNAPWRDPANLTAVPSLPLSGRAPFIVQSAGIDGYYFGRKDRGAKQFAPGGPITFGTNFAPNIAASISATNQYLDKNGKPTNIDVLADFDDLFSYGGS